MLKVNFNVGSLNIKRLFDVATHFKYVYIYIILREKSNKMWLGKTMNSFDVFQSGKQMKIFLFYIRDYKTLYLL